MSLSRRLLTVAAVAAVLLVQGCSPMLHCSIETQVYPDYTCTRITRMEIRPHPDAPGQRTRLADFFQFPPAELYDSYAVQQERALFAGAFPSFEQVPSDLVRITPGTQSRAANYRSFRVMDMVLFVLADFDETIGDIVTSQQDGEAALAELFRLLVPEVMSVLNAKYGQRYDMSRLEAWLNNDLPQKLRRAYAAAWAIHIAKRSGVTSPGEEFEFYMFLRAEAKRDGLELAEPGHPDMRKENIRRLKEYGIKLAQRLCTPKQAGTGDIFTGAAPEDLLASLQQAITARHGSVNNFVGKIASLVPTAFGAYLTSAAMPIYMLPDVTYHYRLKLPGDVIQTNGVRELDGDLVWNFTDRDLAFTGQSLWARSIFVREPSVLALGLKGFPASLGDVDKMFGLCLGQGGEPREGLLRTLHESVLARSLAPLEALAANTGSPDAQAAKGMLELFRQSQTAAAKPALREQPQTAPPQTGMGSPAGAKRQPLGQPPLPQ